MEIRSRIPAAPVAQFGTVADAAETVAQMLEDQVGTQQDIQRDARRAAQESDKQRIGDMRRAADAKFASAIATGVSSIVSGGLQIGAGVATHLAGQAERAAEAQPARPDGSRPTSTSNAGAWAHGLEGAAGVSEGAGQLVAGVFNRDASLAETDAEQHRLDAEAHRETKQAADDQIQRLNRTLDRAGEIRDQAIVEDGQRRSQRV